MKQTHHPTRRNLLQFGAGGVLLLSSFGCSRRDSSSADGASTPGTSPGTTTPGGAPSAASPAPGPAPAQPATTTPPSNVPSPPTVPQQTAAPAPQAQAGAGAETAAGAGADRVDENSATAKALNYHQDATEVKDPKRTSAQVCSTCQFYGASTAAPGRWASCSVFQNKLVASNGWCSSWIKKA